MKIKHMNVLINSVNNTLIKITESKMDKSDISKIENFQIDKAYNLYFKAKANETGFFLVSFDENCANNLFNSITEIATEQTGDKELISSCLNEVAAMIKNEAGILLVEMNEAANIEFIEVISEGVDFRLDGVVLKIETKSKIGEIDMYFAKK